MLLLLSLLQVLLLLLLLVLILLPLHLHSVKLDDAPGSASALIADLNVIFALLDAEVEAHPGAVKIKTVLGYYMVAAGVPDATDDHAMVFTAAAAAAAAAATTTTINTTENCYRCYCCCCSYAGCCCYFTKYLLHHYAQMRPRLVSTATPPHSYYY